MSNFICGADTYEAIGPKRDIFALFVKPASLPPMLDIDGYTLLLRDEFHITLVAPGRIAEQQGITDPDFVEKVQKDFCAFTAERPIAFERFRDEFRFCSKEEKRTVVVMCDVYHLDEFFAELNAKYDLRLEVPPTHVTLYTLDGKLGIFLTGKDDIERFTRLIPAPVRMAS